MIHTYILHTPLILKLLFVALLLFTSCNLYTQAYGWSFIDNVNLIFHEAGHVLLFPFGQFIYVLGGTLFEIGIPLLVTLYFLYQKELFSAGFGAWWLSTALWSVSIYSADAVAQELPLITGNTDHHDWTYLLGTMSLLDSVDTVGTIFL